MMILALEYVAGGCALHGATVGLTVAIVRFDAVAVRGLDDAVTLALALHEAVRTRPEHRAAECQGEIAPPAPQPVDAAARPGEAVEMFGAAHPHLAAGLRIGQPARRLR